MTTQAIPAPTTPATSPKELFVLSDEQILDIASETDAPADTESAGRVLPLNQSKTEGQPEHTADCGSHSAPSNSTTDHESRATGHDSTEPPAWLAAQMNDPWGGEEAREFWNGVQQARQEAAACQAYRASFASPEDARALKELYPGGVSEARAAANRARTLEEIDRAYFGAAGNSPEQLSASRAQLAQRMLQEDPAAFREMLTVSLRALQQVEQGITPSEQSISALPRLAKAAAPREDLNVAQPFRPASSIDTAPQTNRPGTNEATAHTSHGSPDTNHDPRLAAYAAFERAANEDLERSVGAAIDHTLAQALPVAQPLLAEQRKGLASNQHTSSGVPVLHARLTSSVRAEVEKALQDDRQLGEQVAQILSARRFDNESRAQIVRLINDRAQQLVPAAAKRVLNEWTQTTLAAHRSRTLSNEPTADLAAASTRSGQSSDWSVQSKSRPAPSGTANRASVANSPRNVNYRKLSDEQILDL